MELCATLFQWPGSPSPKGKREPPASPAHTPVWRLFPRFSRESLAVQATSSKKKGNQAEDVGMFHILLKFMEFGSNDVARLHS